MFYKYIYENKQKNKLCLCVDEEKESSTFK